ncbi:hypothetical protein [Mycolicibacterium tusciae]|uniref:Uncharacterized protein n=1 Tax=Mycolicibacterium tusciae TaxID=75922 RepID=A0A1X0JY70_9MYCO|nr:hypothetical protein [Mycolicibacterium tusciae]ORB67680.1 hypothetical protein BST47_04165 [Mycolicibacterium tusciae]
MEENVTVDVAAWLTAVDRHPETIDTDRLIAEFLAQRPGRLWSLNDVLHGLHRERDLSDLRDAVNELVWGWWLEPLLEVSCEYGNGCIDPLCGDMLFRIILPTERR